jgi:hypothetical protein
MGDVAHGNRLILAGPGGEFQDLNRYFVFLKDLSQVAKCMIHGREPCILP